MIFTTFLGMFRVALTTLILAIIPVATKATLPLSHLELSNVDASWRPSEFLLRLYKKHQQGSSLKLNVTTTNDEELVNKMNELLTWTPPDYIVKNFPYNFTGYSYEGNPVWIVEGGKFDLNDLMRQGPEMLDAAELAAEQALLRALRSIDTAKTLEDGEVRGFEGITDLEGMNINKFSNPAAMAFGSKMARRYFGIGLPLLRKATAINSNYYVETMLNLFRPAVGQLLERVEVYGPERRKWLPRLLKLYPSSSLPPQYGGDKDFKPVEAYGY